MSRATLIGVVTAVVIVGGAAAAAVVLSKGDGGGGAYVRSTTAECLQRAGVQFVEQPGYKVPGGAPIDAYGGVLAVRLLDNRAIVIFERSGADARRDIAPVQEMAKEFGGTDAEILRLHRNTLVLWQRSPTPDERSQLEGCLST